MKRSNAFIRPLVLIMLSILTISVITYFATLQPLPSKLSIAAAQPGGQYTEFATVLSQTYQQKNPGKTLDVISTQGSTHNISSLKNRKSDIAIIQHNAQIPNDFRIICPIHTEATHIIVRTNSNINSIKDLQSKSISIGLQGSGMRQTALKILKAYNISPNHIKSNNTYFKDILANPTLDGAIVHTGLHNHDLQEVIATNQFKFLPIKFNKAIATQYPALKTYELPAGYYSISPTLPQDAISTLSTQAVLIAHKDTSATVIKAILKAVYAPQTRSNYQHLLPKNTANNLAPLNYHPAAVDFFTHTPH